MALNAETRWRTTWCCRLQSRRDRPPQSARHVLDYLAGPCLQLKWQMLLLWPKPIAGNTGRLAAAGGRLSGCSEGTTGWPVATPTTGGVVTIANLSGGQEPGGWMPDLTLGNRPRLEQGAQSRRSARERRLGPRVTVASRSRCYARAQARRPRGCWRPAAFEAYSPGVWAELDAAGGGSADRWIRGASRSIRRISPLSPGHNRAGHAAETS